MSKMSRQIVVDASIAKSAGDTDHPTSVMCRAFLTSMLRICHKMVWNPEIEQEWKKHASRFSSSWLVAMQNKRKVVRIVADDAKREELRTLITECEDWPPSWREAAIKDLLLVLAAWEADDLVASGDDKVRGLFAKLCPNFPDLYKIVWVNPCSPVDDSVRWLEAGARRSDDRQLGSVDLDS